MAAFRQPCYYTRYHRQCPGNGRGRTERIFGITVIAGPNRHLLIVAGVISARRFLIILSSFCHQLDVNTSRTIIIIDERGH